jgi:hypothetical protein
MEATIQPATLSATPPASIPTKSKARAPFALTLLPAFSTFQDGKPAPIPYVIDGLLTQGGFSILAGKPKLGKSSMARYEAVRVAKGQPFLGRATTKGEVILISLEDGIAHVDNCLKALGYDAATDARILIVDKLAPSITESIDAIGHALSQMPLARLVIVDTLAKLLRCDDLNDYVKVMNTVEKVHDLACKFPQLHIQGLAHCKKARTDSIFDSLLGSTALRGETDTTIALYEDAGNRVIAAEARKGRNLEPTIFTGTLIESAGANVVCGYSLGAPLSDWKSEVSSKKEEKATDTYRDRIVRFLLKRPNYTAFREMLLQNVTGNRASLIDALADLAEEKSVNVTGTAQSSTDPLMVRLDPYALPMIEFKKKFGKPVTSGETIQ